MQFLKLLKESGSQTSSSFLADVGFAIETLRLATTTTTVWTGQQQQPFDGGRLWMKEQVGDRPIIIQFLSA
jgi:hypothetical protein